MFAQAANRSFTSARPIFSETARDGVVTYTQKTLEFTVGCGRDFARDFI
jgi:hypothetical protein